MVWYDYNLEKEEKPLNKKLLNKIDYCIEKSYEARAINFLTSVKENYYKKRKVTQSQIKVINEIYNKIKQENDNFIDDILEGIC